MAEAVDNAKQIGDDVGSRNNKTRANGKRLAFQDREALIRLAMAAIPLMTPYQAASYVMNLSSNYGSPIGTRITRRSAMHLLAQARARLNAEMAEVEPDFRTHAIWKARELYREVLAAARSNAQTAYRYYRVLADLIKVDMSINNSSAQSVRGQDDVKDIIFQVVGVDDVHDENARRETT